MLELFLGDVNMSVNETRNYESLKRQIQKQVKEVDYLIREYSRLKHNKRKVEAKNLKRILKAEKNQLKRLYKKRNAYINVKAEMKKQLNINEDYKNGEISEIRKNAETLTSKLKVRAFKGKYNKNLPSYYIDEIKENVRKDYSKAKGKQMDFGTFKRKAGVGITIAAMITATLLLVKTKKSINDAPDDLYPKQIPTLDEFSVLVKKVHGENNIPTSKPKENREVITPEFTTLNYNYDNNDSRLQEENSIVDNNYEEYLYNYLQSDINTENEYSSSYIEDYADTISSSKLKK